MIHHSQSDRGGLRLRLQDNRQAGQSTNPNQPTPSLTVAGLLASGQSADWFSEPSTTINHLSITHYQPDRGGLRLQDNRLTVAGFGFRTIGRQGKQRPQSTTITHYQSDRGGLWLQDNRQTGQSIHPNQPPRSTTIHHYQSDRGGLWLQDNRQTSQSIHPNQPPRSTTIHHYQSDRGGLRLQDNRQAGQSTNPNQPTPSLTVAGLLASGQSADWLSEPSTTINHLSITHY
ncbi:hypothetical protein N7534_001193 [Penicillium rubens]|nr:hypothetical protein N7534_001193 [Penicillium rubens]